MCNFQHRVKSLLFHLNIISNENVIITKVHNQNESCSSLTLRPYSRLISRSPSLFEARTTILSGSTETRTDSGSKPDRSKRRRKRRRSGDSPLARAVEFEEWCPCAGDPEVTPMSCELFENIVFILRKSRISVLPLRRETNGSTISSSLPHFRSIG